MKDQLTPAESGVAAAQRMNEVVLGQNYLLSRLSTDIVNKATMVGWLPVVGDANYAGVFIEMLNELLDYIARRQPNRR